MAFPPCSAWRGVHQPCQQDGLCHVTPSKPALPLWNTLQVSIPFLSMLSTIYMRSPLGHIGQLCTHTGFLWSFIVRYKHTSHCINEDNESLWREKLSWRPPDSLSFLSPHLLPQNDRKKSTPRVPPRSHLISNASPLLQPIFGWLLCLLTKRRPPKVEAPPISQFFDGCPFGA